MKNNKRIRIALSIGLASIIMVVLGFMIFGVYTFFTNYGLQSPIVLRSPVYPLRNEVVVSPIKGDKKQKSMILDLGKIADKIYTLESSGGKNDSCKEIGKVNGYGYRQNTSEWICYGSHEEVRKLVINWLLSHLKTMSIEEALCHYNQGTITNSCTYAMNYKSL
jgi:hypothetical protein